MKLDVREAMSLALEEGRKGAGFVSPNPLVGCVILDKDGRFLAKGYHARLGDLHAETHALGQVKDPTQLKDAHVIVTLEPCAHEGRQPSCAKTLAQLPIKRVTFALLDPNPLVSGKGAEILRQAGKEVVEFKELHEEAEELAEIFLLNQRHKRPFVSLKVAASLDGQVAMPNGESRWITGPAAREVVHRLRGEHDICLTGAGTVLLDDPSLDSRDVRFASRPKRLAVLDRDGEVLEKIGRLKISKVRKPEDLWVFTMPGLPLNPYVQHVTLPAANGTFDLGQVLQVLQDKARVHSVFVEAGPHTVSSFLQANLVDRLYLFTAPKIIGRGQSWSSGLQLESLAKTIALNQTRWEKIGEDWLVQGRPQRL